MKIIQRIFQYIDFQHINKSEFERKTGVSNGYFAKMRARNADIGESIVFKILENCPEISPSWLVFGEEPMLREDKRQNIENKASVPVAQKTGNEQENSYLFDKFFQQLEEKNKEIQKLCKEIGRLEAENEQLTKHSNSP